MKREKIIDGIILTLVIIVGVLIAGLFFYFTLKQKQKEYYNETHYDKTIEVLSFVYEEIEFDDGRVGYHYHCLTNDKEYPVVNVSPANVTTYYHKTKWNLSDSLKGTITATVKRNLEGVWFLIVYVNG